MTRQSLGYVKDKREEWLKQRDDILSRQEQLRKELARLNSYLNVVAPINTLPNELLVEIFACVRAQSSSYSYARYATTEWMSVLAVCRHWRTLAASSALFWREVNVYRSPCWLSLCLSRCSSVRTDVYFRDLDFPPSRLLLLAPHAAFIRVLDIAGAKASWTAQLVTLFSMPMAALEVVRIHADVDVDVEHEYEDLGLCPGRLPHLRSLSLSGYFAPRDKLLYANLRTLEIARCIWTMTFNQFLDLLEASERLERLILDNCLVKLFENPNSRNPRPPHRSPPITLSTVRTLSVLGDSPWVISQFLSYLCIPNACDVSLDADVGVFQIRHLSDTIREVLPVEPSTVFPMLTAATHVEVAVHNDDYALCVHAKDQTISLSLSSSKALLSWDAHFGNVLSRSADVLADAPVTDLEVRGDYTVPDFNTWEYTFHRYPNLETLTLSGTGPLDNVWRALASNGDEGDKICCPRLKCIRTGEEPGLMETHFLCTELVDTLRTREQHGLRLATIHARLYMYDPDGDEDYEPLNEDIRESYLWELERLVDRLSVDSF